MHDSVAVTTTSHHRAMHNTESFYTILPTPKMGNHMIIALETGYVEKNEWLEWMQYTAKQNERSNCIACSTARPTLGTSPFRLSNQDDPTGLQCVLQLFHKDSVLVTEQCKSLSLLFPAVQQKDRPPSAGDQTSVFPGTCLYFTSCPGRPRFFSKSEEMS
uniref:Uncharacterized protein n=1 Tax=Astyanax mexicanus TaxID=7994 RepID=A0A3B1KG46_ASTMX